MVVFWFSLKMMFRLKQLLLNKDFILHYETFSGKSNTVVTWIISSWGKYLYDVFKDEFSQYFSCNKVLGKCHMN